jgi:hypothetical protein
LFDVQSDAIAVIVTQTCARGDYHAFGWLFFGAVRDDQTTRSFFFAFNAFDKNAVVQRGKCHL